MSIKAENVEHELSVEDFLSLILKELKLLNARVEDGFETGITEDGLNDD